MEAVMEMVGYYETFLAVVRAWGYFRRFLRAARKRVYLAIEAARKVCALRELARLGVERKLFLPSPSY